MTRESEGAREREREREGAHQLRTIDETRRICRSLEIGKEVEREKGERRTEERQTGKRWQESSVEPHRSEKYGFYL